MSAESGDTSDGSPMPESSTHSKWFSHYGRPNGALLLKILDAITYTFYNKNYVVVVVGIDTWMHVYPAFIRTYVLLTGEPRIVRNELPFLSNLVIPAPTKTYHDAVRFLRDTAPNSESKLIIGPWWKDRPSTCWHKGRPWDIFHEGKHTFAFRPLSSLYSVNNMSPLALYDVVIRNMFFFQNSCWSTRMMFKKICDTLKAVDYNQSIAVFVPDDDTQTILQDALPMLPNLVAMVPEGCDYHQALSSIASIELEEWFSSVPRQVIEYDEFIFAFGPVSSASDSVLRPHDPPMTQMTQRRRQRSSPPTRVPRMIVRPWKGYNPTTRTTTTTRVTRRRKASNPNRTI